MTTRQRAARELRHRAFALQVRDVAEGEPLGQVTGLITTYNAPYDIGWGWREQITPGTFAESLMQCNGRIAIYLQHNHIRGAAPIGVAEVRDTGNGLVADAQLYMEEHPDAPAVYRALKDGTLREWSIGYWTEDYTEDANARMDTVTKGDLAEASIVLRGANPETDTFSVRSAPESPAPEAPVTDGKTPFVLPGDLSSPAVRRLVHEHLAVRNDDRSRA